MGEFIAYTLPEVVARELRDGRLQDVSDGNDAITHSYAVKGYDAEDLRLWIDADKVKDREFPEFKRFTVMFGDRFQEEAGLYESETGAERAVVALYEAAGVPVPIYLRQSDDSLIVNGEVVRYLGRYVRNKADVCVIESDETGERAYLEYDHPTGIAVFGRA